MMYSILYGKGKINFTIPKDFLVDTLISKYSSPITSLYEKTLESLLHPINSSPLNELVKGKKSVCIVVTDITRECPDKEILPPILEIIETQVKHENISILIASGMHKKMNYEEKVEKYGKKIVEDYRIIEHNGSDKDLIFMGHTKNGTPIKISKHVMQADFLISLGVVEPHQFAGYSGGYKTVSIGLAGDETISHTHSSNFLRKSDSRVGKIQNNLIYEEIIEIGEKVGLDFIVNVILGNNKEVVEIQSGEPLATHNYLIKKARELYEVPVKKLYNVVICGVGYPRDSNLYQATIAASYVFFAPKPIIKENGYIIIPALCNEGAGNGIGDKRFFKMLKTKSISEIINLNEEFKTGEQRSFFIACVLNKCKIIVVGSQTPNIIQEAKMIPAQDMKEALDIIKNDLKNNIDILLIPNSLFTLPILE
ncbi:MAG TPA: nickel-dependent lactate racemase [Nitrosopumilaceae archaeon]|nr:nickel-dependent lactate racemase [Nitrosopumilaceae archaeon]